MSSISAFQASALSLRTLTRGDALRACPWLLYSAPLALSLPLAPGNCWRNPLFHRTKQETVFQSGVNLDFFPVLYTGRVGSIITTTLGNDQEKFTPRFFRYVDVSIAIQDPYKMHAYRCQ